MVVLRDFFFPHLIEHCFCTRILHKVLNLILWAWKSSAGVKVINFN